MTANHIAAGEVNQRESTSFNSIPHCVTAPVSWYIPIGKMTQENLICGPLELAPADLLYRAALQCSLVNILQRWRCWRQFKEAEVILPIEIEVWATGIAIGAKCMFSCAGGTYRIVGLGHFRCGLNAVVSYQIWSALQNDRLPRSISRKTFTWAKLRWHFQLQKLTPARRLSHCRTTEQ